MTISNLPYYRKHQYGGEAYKFALFNGWVGEGKEHMLLSSLQLYNFLLTKGVKNFFILGRDENYREIMRGNNDQGTIVMEYKLEKRGKLVKKGYWIWGNVGDQWTDITRTYVGSHTFKIPMYYIS
ncbi:hypothetical protein SUGI_0033870 [Cryptomeria japonica]|nr:hypothetical protein SUGI_0033870 [Cryptomeria japonica]